MTPFFGLLSLFGGSSPSYAAAGSGFETALKTYFPGALSSSIIALRVVGALRKRDYRPYNTLVASSICSDEINELPNSLISTLEKQLGNTKTGGVFHLGGLGGLPFVGVSGMGALVQHCPSTAGEGGKMVLVFGPHVGISESGELGKLQRGGMETETTACGAAMGAYQAISSGTKPKSDGVMDFQEDYIIDNLKKKLGTLAGKEAQGGDETIALVTEKMYDLVYELLKSEVDAVITAKGPDFWKNVQEVTLLGGIIINRSAKGGAGGEDYFQPLTMRTITSKGEDKGIYNDVFGDLLTPRKKL
jgi:hypothetical protein